MQNQQQYLTYEGLIRAARAVASSPNNNPAQRQLPTHSAYFPIPGEPQRDKADPHSPWKTLMEQQGGTLKILNLSGIALATISISCTFEELASRLRSMGANYAKPGQSDRSVGFGDVISLTPEQPKAYKKQLRILARFAK